MIENNTTPNKLPSKYENPFDIIILKMASNTIAFYKQLNLTPNCMTTLSLLFGLLSVYLFYLDKNLLAGITIIISYYFDCVDGMFARKYNMVTDFGDMYDHISDIVKSVLLLIVMYSKSKKKFSFVAPIIIIVFILSLLHLGCQEKYYKTKDDKGRKFLRQLKLLYCDESLLKYSRFFGCGTFVVTIALLVIFWNKL
jgi:phosphatidylglycerophosphate synthase